MMLGVQREGYRLHDAGECRGKVTDYMMLGVWREGYRLHDAGSVEGRLQIT